MNQVNLTLVLEDLDSSKLETQVLAVEQAADIVQVLAVEQAADIVQVLAVEQAADIVQVLAMKVLETFKTSNNPFLIAEHLYQFGSILVPHLETLFQETENSELKLLSAIVLLRLGSQVGVSYLLQAIIDDQQYPCLVASCLASIPIYEAINPILQRLRSADLQEIDLIIGLLTVLEEFNHNIPNDLYERFTASEAPWQVQAVAKSVFQTLASRPQMKTMKTIKFIDLFAGIGGIRLAFETAASSLGFKPQCLLSSEINQDSRWVYQANFKENALGDIRTIEQLPEHDVLLAGFPCQSFSYAGKKEGFGDTRGILFFEIMRLIDTNKPQIIILENVRGILTNYKGITIKTIEYEIKKRGYSFQLFLLNSCNFGLPQNRLRAYIIAVLGQSPKFNIISDTGPQDSHSYIQQLSLFQQHQFSSVKTILEDDPDPKYDCSPIFIEQLKKYLNGDLEKLHGKKLIDYRGGNSIHSWELGLKGECSPQEIELMNCFILKRRNKEFGEEQDGKLLTKAQIATFFNPPNLDDLLQSLVNKKYLKVINHQYKPVSGNFSFEVYKFLDPESIAVTLVASDANKLGVYHNHRVRRITPREAARLQGFPDQFYLHYHDDKAYYQLGNSVSINVVEFIAKEVLLKAFLGACALME